MCVRQDELKVVAKLESLGLNFGDEKFAELHLNRPHLGRLLELEISRPRCSRRLLPDEQESGQSDPCAVLDQGRTPIYARTPERRFRSPTLVVRVGVESVL